MASSNGGGHGWGLEFYDCVINNDLARLETLVDQHNIDLNAKFTEVRKKNHVDLSPIHLVAYKGYTGMLQYLFDMKCDIHQTTATLRRTAFHFAVLRHKMACFHKLLSFGANPDPRDTFGNTPCHYAAEDGAVNLLDVLLRQSIEPNAQDITGKTPLMKATRNGKIDAVRRLVDAKCDLNVRDRNSDTAFHFAARHGSARLLHVLIAAGQNDASSTAAAAAASQEDQKGGPPPQPQPQPPPRSDANVQNQWGHTPLMEAVCYSNKDAAACLLQAGCDVNLRENRGGDTALHVSVRKNYSVITEQLLSTGKVKHVYNYQGELAILDAVVNQKLDTVRLFLQYNYDLDVPCKLDYDGSGGKLAVRIALDRENFDLLRLLAAVGYVISSPAGGGAVADGSSETTAQRLLAEVCQVRSLKSMCRRTIRKRLGFGILYKVTRLPLPPWLQDYVLLTDILSAAVNN